MPDARESHTWVSRCFGLVFTAMKTQKVKTGREPGSQENPLRQRGGSGACGTFRWGPGRSSKS